MANGIGGGAASVPVDPPPPPSGMRMLSFGFGAGAVIAGFAGFCMLAAILALLSLIFNLADYFLNRGVVRVPLSAVDEEGRLKALKKQDTSADPTRPDPTQLRT